MPPRSKTRPGEITDLAPDQPSAALAVGDDLPKDAAVQDMSKPVPGDKKKPKATPRSRSKGGET
jgi:hypothetical protein